MALNTLTIKHASRLNIVKYLSVNKLSWLLVITAVLAASSAIYSYNRIQQIAAFNIAVSAGKPPKTDMQSFEAKFSTAFWLARNERYKEATLLFNKALNGSTI
jgi:mxaK protein